MQVYKIFGSLTMENSQMLRIGVLTGGCGIEKEVSFNSGRTICDHLDTTLYKVIPIYQAGHNELYILPWYFLHRGKTSDFESRLKNEAERISWDDLKSLVDFVYIAMHGRYAEDGTLQGMLEVLGIPYLGSRILASALSMDKAIQRKVLESSGIKIPKGFALNPHYKNLDEVIIKIKENHLSYPLVIKPSGEGSSLGVSFVMDESELESAIQKAMNCDPSLKQAAIIEEKIEGMEFTAIHLQKKLGQINVCNKGSALSDMLQHSNLESEVDEWLALPLTEIVIENQSKFYDYEQKYMPGRASKITPARCSSADFKKINEICLKIIKLFDLSTFSRIDGFLTKEGEVVIIDINSLSGMTPTSFIFHQAAEMGMSHTQLINYLIEFELERHIERKDLFSFSTLNPKNSGDSGMNLEKIKVAILLGGDSNEKEISLDSGRNVCYKLSPKKYEVIPLFVDEQMRLFRLSLRHLIQNSTSDIKMLLSDDLEVKWSDLPSLVDFVFIALHGGKGENGTLQGALEMLRIPYNGSGVLASSLCMDKYKTNDFLRNNGFDVPKSKLISNKEWSLNKELLLEEILAGFAFPLILKPHNDGCSFFVKKVVSNGDLIASMDEFFMMGKDFLMVEEFINAIELTCGVMGNEESQALPPSMPLISSNILSIEEKFLPGAGENQTPAPIKAEALKLVMQTMEKVYETIGCKGYVRIDCFYQEAKNSPAGKDRVIILEINTLPGLTPATCIFHQAAEIGLRPMDFIEKIVEFGMQLHKPELKYLHSSNELKTDEI